MKAVERIAWAGITLAAVLWGLAGRSASPAAAAQGEPQNGSRPGSYSSQAEARQERGAIRAEAPKGRASVSARCAAALRSEDPLSRTALFLDLLSSCDAAGFEQISATLAGQKVSGISHPELQELLDFRGGQLKGAELLPGHTGSAADFEKIGSLTKQYEGWIHGDPTAASRWLDSLPAGKFRDRMTMTYLAAAAKDDPAGTTALAASLHPSQQATAGRSVARRLMESSGAGDTAALLQTIQANAGSGDAAYLSGLFDGFAEDAAKDGNLETASFLERNLGSPYLSSDALALVSKAKAKTDPLAALEWAASCENGTAAGGSILQAAVTGMDLAGIEKASQWLGSHPETPGAANLKSWIGNRRRILEDNGDDANEYDKDD